MDIPPPANVIEPPSYVSIICEDAVWVKALFALIQKKFGYGQQVQQYDCYADLLADGRMVFFMNRVTMPMEKLAAMGGIPVSRLNAEGGMRLLPIPFDKDKPRPTVDDWGTA